MENLYIIVLSIFTSFVFHMVLKKLDQIRNDNFHLKHAVDRLENENLIILDQLNRLKNENIVRPLYYSNDVIDEGAWEGEQSYNNIMDSVQKDK